MSDNWVTIVPRLPDHVPASVNAQAAKAIFKQMAPEADELEIIEHEHIQFFDCGGNLETISCPKCRSQISFDWWGQTMSADFDENTGFQLKEYSPPCCPASTSLNELNYDFHQAFGRFALSAMNPNVGALTVEEIKIFEVALGCEVSIVYQHI